MTFHKKYKKVFNQIYPDQDLMERILEKAKQRDIKETHAFRYVPKPLAAAVIGICIFITVPVLAANVEPVYQLMYLVSPTIARFFKPVQRSCQDNGIKMEVVSAYIRGNTAQIYITMEDLTHDRIDGTIDLYDSFSINRPFDSTAVCELAGFDASAKKATFLITMNEWGNKNIEGDKITFSVREFLSHKTIYDNQYIPVSLTGIQPAEDTRPVAVYGLGGPDVNRTDRDNITALSPGSPREGFPIDGIDFTGIGYIDGKLHIQTRIENVLENDNHGYFYLKDRNGKEIKYDYSFNFSDNDEASARYCEYIFDIPIQTISSYSLYGYFVTSGMKTEGNWSVTFPLETEPEHNIK